MDGMLQSKSRESNPDSIGMTSSKSLHLSGGSYFLLAGSNSTASSSGQGLYRAEICGTQARAVLPGMSGCNKSLLALK